eukprot:36640_1
MSTTKKKNKCKGTSVDDIIECRICGKRMARRRIDEYFETYRIAKDGHPNHPNTLNKTFKGYLSCNRGPITTSRAKYPIGKVFDRKEKKSKQSIHGILDSAGVSDMVFDDNAFSEYESEDLHDYDNSDDEVIQDQQFMDANDITLGFE